MVSVQVKNMSKITTEENLVAYVRPFVSTVVLDLST